MHEYGELPAIRANSPFVFAAYNHQARLFHWKCNRPTDASLVTMTFAPTISVGGSSGDFSAGPKPSERASLNPCFSQDFASIRQAGRNVNNQVARDDRVGTAVMMRHYVKEDDPERRNASNRTFYRIADSLAPETARRIWSPDRPEVHARSWRRPSRGCRREGLGAGSAGYRAN